MEEVAIKEAGSRLLPYLRESLAYTEARIHGEYIRSLVSKLERTGDMARFLYELGWIYDDMGDAKKAIGYYEQALAIYREVYGQKHPYVATTLNNLGLAWRTLGDAKKAIDYYEQALSIDIEVYGKRHPNVATDLNNIGGAWKDLGDDKKTMDYFQQAYSIFYEFYGADHPRTKAVKEWLAGLKGQ